MKITLIPFLIYSQFHSLLDIQNYFSLTSFWAQPFLNSQTYMGLDDLLSLESENWPITIVKFVFIPFLLLIMTTTILLLIRNQYMGIELEKRKKSIEEDVNTLLTGLICYEQNSAQISKKIEAFKLLIPFHKKWCQNYILHKILEINQTFHVNQNFHRDIFKLFGFDKISHQLLRHKKWYLKSLGIYRLQRMHEGSKRKQIRTFLKDSNPEVKSNALIAMVSLSPKKFAALRDYDEPLTKADEMKILDIIYENGFEMPKSSEELLKSKNISIVVLGIKLMVQYKVKFSLEQMENLIRFSNFKVRREAIKAVGKLKMVEANEILIDQYDLEQNTDVKMTILKSLKRIGNQRAVLYLQSILAMENNSDIKFEMVACINALNPAFFEHTYSTIIAKDTTIKDMALHAKDPYLV